MPKGPKNSSVGNVERIGTVWGGLREWLYQSWRIGVRLAKGGYLMGERRRTLIRLGEETYAQLQEGALDAEKLQPWVTQLNRLTKKVQLEEWLINRYRYGAGRKEKPKISKPGSNRSVAET